MENPVASLLPCLPGHLPASAIASVQRIHRLFLKILEARIGELLQSSVAAAPSETRQGVMADYVSAASGCHLLALDVAPAQGHAALSFSVELLRAVLDILLAKPPGAAATQKSPLTEIELHVLRDFFEAFTGTLRKAWAPAFPVVYNRLSAGIDDARQILGASAGDSVLVLPSRLSVAGVNFTFDLALPGFLIRMAEARAASAQTRGGVSLPPEAVVAGPLGAAIVELEAVLRGVTLPMDDLLALKPEQILLLGAPVDARFDCLVNGKAQFSGEMVACAGRHCFRIETVAG